jgi:hypothetical protein
MSRSLRAAFFWTPRVGGILFILFLSMFALDILGQGYSVWQTIVGLTVHLLPSIVLTVALILAWRREWIGALWFAGWAIFYVVTMRGFPLTVYLIIAGIPSMIAILFLCGWIYRNEIRPVHA